MKMFLFSFLKKKKKSTNITASCSWSPKQGHTKDPDLGGGGVIFLRTGIIYIISVTELTLIMLIIGLPEGLRW